MLLANERLAFYSIAYQHAEELHQDLGSEPEVQAEGDLLPWHISM